MDQRRQTTDHGRRTTDYGLPTTTALLENIHFPQVSMKGPTFLEHSILSSSGKLGPFSELDFCANQTY